MWVSGFWSQKTDRVCESLVWPDSVTSPCSCCAQLRINILQRTACQREKGTAQPNAVSIWTCPTAGQEQGVPTDPSLHTRSQSPFPASCSLFTLFSRLAAGRRVAPCPSCEAPALVRHMSENSGAEPLPYQGRPLQQPEAKVDNEQAACQPAARPFLYKGDSRHLGL